MEQVWICSRRCLVLKLKESTVPFPFILRDERCLVQSQLQDKGQGFSFIFGLSWVEAIFPWCSVLKWPLGMHGQSQFRSPRAVWGPQVDGEADGPFVSSEDSSPATDFESNFYLPHIPATKSCPHASQKKSLGVKILQRTFRSRSSFGFSTTVALAIFLYNHLLLKSPDSQFYRPGTCNLYNFVYAQAHHACPKKG